MNERRPVRMKPMGCTGKGKLGIILEESDLPHGRRVPWKSARHLFLCDEGSGGFRDENAGAGATIPKQENCFPFETLPSSPAVNGDIKEDEFVDRDDVASVTDLLKEHSFDDVVDPINTGADCSKLLQKCRDQKRGDICASGFQSKRRQQQLRPLEFDFFELWPLELDFRRENVQIL
ncbi:hypothetical protein L6452_08064 [Arctium lappa]|uniref:Uncharacterized protein n=1 Tax=Arctium lappa TaxID=4217 RepID=A0ACB9DHB9_ARCLA|nr:hypothetical protein L6452_08064 [Arctium lappa]